MKNQVVLNIMGQPYVVVADESKEYMEQVADMANKELEDIASRSRLLPKMNLTVLGILNVCDKYIKSEAENRRMREKLQQLMQEKEQDQQNGSDAKKEIYRLRSEMTELKNKLRQLEHARDTAEEATEEVPQEPAEAAEETVEVEQAQQQEEV